MRWLIYNVLFAVGFALLLPRFLYRMARRGGYRRGFLQRVAWYDRGVRERLRSRERVWVHAVSVGEIYVALRFIREWKEREPGAAFVLTTTTSTAHRIGEKALAPEDVLLYFPVDFPFVMRRVLDAIRPRALVLTELEIWPNLVRLAARRGVPVVLLNGRISDRSFRGYRRVRGFLRPVVRSLRLMLVQSAADEQRLVALGAERGRIRVLGTAKYDVADMSTAGASAARAVLARCGIADDDPVVVAGSTWPGEELALLKIFGLLKAQHPRLRLVLVPRHAERGRDVAEAIRARGVTFARRSELVDGQKTPAPVDVLLVDTTGELRHFYACATAIFVGKSLLCHGGQNVIEPAIFGKPIVVGPHMENFGVVMEDFLKAAAIVQVRDAAELGAALARLLADADERARRGARAAAVVTERRGVIAASVRCAREVVTSRGA